MNKTRNSLLSSITSVLFTFINGLCNLVVTRKVIEVYGSDFNGLNSTATQFINVLLIIEGGFAIAANVALFKPLSSKDEDGVIKIFRATDIKFRKIASIFSIAGILTSVVFTYTINSSLPIIIRFAVFLMLVSSTSFSLLYATKYKILFQSDQKEYVINIVSIITYSLTYILMYIQIILGRHMLLLRLNVMLFAILNSLIVGVLCKKKYPYILKKNAEPDFASIKGTGDVFVQKIIGVVYYAAPIVAISTMVSTMAASVYAVYNTVFTLIRSAENSIINAPRMSLGRLAAEEGTNSDRFKDVYNQYEFCMFFSISLMLSVATVLIMPFVSIYSKSFVDINYYNWKMAIIMTLICFIECIHIPSGNLINMSGRFREGRNIQIAAGIVLILSLFVGGRIFGIDGILIAVLLTACVLAVLEIGYIRFRVVKNDNFTFFRNLGVNTLASVLLIVLELQFTFNISSFGRFFIYAALITTINGVTLMFMNILVNRRITMVTIQRFLHLFCRN